MEADPAGPAPADEGRHVPGEGPWWAERWWFDWVDGSGAGGFVELVLLPNRRRAWYRAALVTPGRPLLAVVDHDAPLPRVGLELRAEGLWADHSVEDPYRQWTVANEAFALAVEDPAELVGRGYGTPTPLALDLEWYATAGPVVRAGGTGYEQPGEVDGIIDRGGGHRQRITGAGRRRHEWGPLTLPELGRLDDAPGQVPDRWPAPFDAVVIDAMVVGAPAVGAPDMGGWVRRRRP